jgi:pyruvate ferredoxin oxidoreductase delta subunit
MYCPDDSVIVNGSKMDGFRMLHCKGCGICAKTCPKKAITMILQE